LRSLLAPLVVAACAAALVPVEAAAGGTKTFTLDDFDDFDEGESEGVAIEGSGRLSVGYVPQRGAVAADASVAFTCAVRGKEALIGTADKATIQRVKVATGRAKKRDSKDKGDKGTKAKKDTKDAKPDELEAEVIAELPGVVVSAIAELPGGDLLAATLPGGTIHRVDRKGKVSEFAKLDVKQIWAIVPHKGRILVGTGPKGELYSLSASGKDPKVVLDVEEKDILSILTVGDASLVGTAPGAKLFQVTSECEGVLIHDFKGDEVRALALTDDGLVAAVNAFSSSGLSSIDALTKNLNRTSLVGQPPEGSSESGQKSVKASAKLYHVNLKGEGGKRRDLARASEATWNTWLSKDKQYFTAAVVTDASRGEVLVSSSYQGKVYRVRGRRDLATVADFDERKATSLCALPDGGVLATTGDGAAVYRLDDTKAQRPRYKSEIFDAKQPATYGALVIRGAGDLKVRARVGPSDDPDKRWSDWAPIVLAKASDGLRGRLNLPKRRFLQLEFTLASADASVRDVEIFYAPENLAPLVKSVEFKRPDFDLDDDDEPESKVTIKWKVDAEDDDDLIYEVRVRPEGGQDDGWIKLHGDDPVTKKELKWDLDSVPDGLYEVEVTASDEPANGVARAQTDAKISPPFVVDRKRPEIDQVKVKGLEVRGLAKDEGGYIHDVSFSVDGGSFRPASPSDGLFDHNREDFTLTLPDDLRPGRHRVVLRARDAFGNMGSVAVVVER
jgi:hypothetical protein